MTRPAVTGFDPDAVDPAVDDGWVEPGWEDPAAPQDVWVDPVDDDPALDTPAARADWAYGRAVDPATPTALLERVADDLATWDVEALLAEVHDGLGEQPVPLPRDRPDVLVLRQLLDHPNRPDDLAARLVAGWLADPSRPPWTLLVALAADAAVPEDDLVTAATEACDAARTDLPPDWAQVVVALAWARADGGAVRDLLALVPWPHDDPSRTWTDALQSVKGLPGGVPARARSAGEALGWDGTRLGDLPTTVAKGQHEADRRARSSSFAPTLELCAHGPVVLTPNAVALPQATRGEKPYIALIAGHHPVFRLKRDWPDRADEGGGTVWSWRGPQVLETRGLGCDACRTEPDRGKAYFVTDGTSVARTTLRRVQGAVERAVADEA